MDNGFLEAKEKNIFSTLKQIALEHRKKLGFSFSLVILENILFLLYPMVGSFAVNAVMKGDVFQALLYALMVFVIWMIGSFRRAIDTRVFVRIYSLIAVPVILNERNKGTTSSATAHANLSRQFVDFFEQHLPIMMTSFFSVIGSVIMLLIIEFWSGVIAFVVLGVFLLLLPRYIKMNDRLYFRLNNRLEKEVEVIERNKKYELTKHYDILAKIRIGISNREAMSYLMIGIAMAVLFGGTLLLLSVWGYGSAGHIYAVITYLWGFAMSIDDIPRLVERFSELKDIGRRVEV